MRRLLLILLFAFGSTAYAQNINFVMLYHSSWGDGRMIDSTFFNRNKDIITHIIHFKIDPVRTPPYISYDGGEGNHSKNRAQIIADAHARGMKVLLCIGGVATGAHEWNFITGDSALTQRVVDAMSAYALQHGYDGLDLDWESEITRDKFMLLSRILRRKLDSWPRRGILTMAIGREWNPAQDVPTLNSLYDYLNIMAYDCNAYWSETSGFHEPLYNPIPNWPNYGTATASLNIHNKSNTWVARGIDKSKTSLGLALYGWAWNPCTGATRPGQNFTFCNNAAGYYNYFDATAQLAAGRGTRYYDSLAHQPWISNPGGNPSYVNYQDAQSLGAKMDYLKAQRWGGLMLFANEHAADLSKPLDQRWPLLTAVRNNMNPPTPSAPAFTSQPLNASIVVGATASFGVQVSGFPAPSLQWQKNGVNISGATNSIYTTPVATIGDNGATFRCIATNSQGSATSNAATLTVTQPTLSAPSFSVHPNNSAVTVGATATFSVTALGVPTPTLQWQRNGANIAGATSASYTTPATVAGDDGATFRCVATNSQGVATSNSALLTVSAPSTAAPRSDDFSNPGRFATTWTSSHPSLTSLVGQNTSDALLRMNLDATAHDMWTNNFGAVRVLQDIVNGNFEVVAKFQSMPTSAYQFQGILVKENATSWLRFDILRDNAGLKFFAGTVTSSSGTAKINNIISISGSQVWVKVNRNGDTWTAYYSTDNSTYTQAGQFTQAIVVDSIGVFAGNQSSGGAVPAFDCKVDYFFNTSSPISPEDPVNLPSGTFGGTPDTLPIGGGNATLTWTSTNATTASIDQGVGNVALSGSTTVAVTQTKTFTLTLTNANGTQTYAKQIVVRLPIGGGIPSGTFTSNIDTLPIGGGNATLTWTSTNAVSASIDQGVGNVALNGSTTVTVGQTKTFTLTLTNASGTKTYSKQIVVLLPGGGGNPNDVTAGGTPIAFISNPTGIGNKNIEIIRDGILPPSGSTNPNDQFDTYNGGGARATDWIGYTYPASQTFGSIDFQEGIHSNDGGFFASSPVIEVRIGGQWVAAPGMTITPTYTGSTAPSFASYRIRFYPITGDGIRIKGTPGGAAKFISVAEFRVYSNGANSVPPEQQPKDIFLLTNYPNPFNPSTTIQFSLPSTMPVKLIVFDVLGKAVRTVIDGVMDQGTWPMTWDGRDEDGRQVSSGVYLYRLQAGSYVETRKMILSK